MNLGFWLRWSGRDLKSRWLQVVGIALIIAFGTGVFAGLDGQETWRKASYDMSYGKLHMYDLQMQLASGSYLNQAEVQAALQNIPGVQTAESRLVTPTLVDASTADQTVIVRGEIIGMDVSDGGPHVNGVYVEDGRTLTKEDSGQNVVIVEYKFAKHYDLNPGSPIRISGGTALDFIGTGHTPEYFMVMPDTGSFFGESSFAALFVPLETAQKLAGRENRVNETLFLLEKNADEASVRAEIENRMA
ncbi:MAG: ABC transporter permease, partial [Anaerolineae bacterium]|nr:ABC transporter permease [Anaerolineae bacterium]